MARIHVSTDQIAAFLEVARHGQLRAAAQVLGISEQGVRNRLLALEQELRVELYRKIRGPRRLAILTDAGHRFVPHAVAFMERAGELYRAFDIDTGPREIRIAASQYLTRYVLIDVLKQFASEDPGIHVRVSTMNERDIEEALRTDAEIAFGFAAPYESSVDIEYLDLFAMGWSLITPRGHRLASKPRLTLNDVAKEPLILYERGSTGRAHVLDAFHERQLTPRLAFETTSTETIVSMVEAGLGVSIVPLLRSGVVTHGRKVDAHPLLHAIRPIHSGILLRRGDKLSDAASRLLRFTRDRYSRGE